MAAAVAKAKATATPMPAGSVNKISELSGKLLDGMMKRTHVCHWLARERLPMSLFPSLMGLLIRLGVFADHTGGTEGMVDSKTSNYMSEKTGWDLVDSLSWVSRSAVIEDINKADVVAATQDESTDAANHSQQVTFFAIPADADDSTSDGGAGRPSLSKVTTPAHACTYYSTNSRRVPTIIPLS